MARSAVSGYFAGLAVAAVCLAFGGWPWALLSLVALVLLARGEFDAGAVSLSACLSLFWLAMFYFTGDRRLFFPFAMQYALQAAYINPTGRSRRSALVVACFLLIRIAQKASLQVLAVEIAVAALVTFISLAAYGKASRGWPARLGWAGFASFLAFLGLAL